MDMQRVAGPPPEPVDASEHLTTALWQRSDDEAEVLRFHDGDRWVTMSWAELAARVRAVAAGLIASGVRPGEPVGVLSPTRPEWTIADLAVLAAAGVTVPVYESGSAQRCAWVLGNTETRLVLAGSPELADRVVAAGDEAEGTEGPEEVLVFDDGALDDLAARGDDNALVELDRRLDGLRAALGGQVRFALSGGGPISDDLVRFLAATGLTVIQGYGLTETSGPATIDRPRDPRVGTVGRPLPGAETAIDDQGEVLVRGPNVFQRYHRDPDTTADTLDEDGWLRTGDLGELDDDGHLRLTGRSMEMIVTAGGKNVAPEPLEEKVREHALIAEPVVIGDGRPFIAALITLDGERVGSFARDHGLPAEELHAHERVRDEVAQTVEEANRQVSKAESIREFRVLERPFRVEDDELTPTRTPRRATILEHFSDVVDGIYEDADPGP